MTTMTITPASARSLKNHVSLGQSVRNSLSMAARGLIKMRRTPEQLIDVTVEPIVLTIMLSYIFGGAFGGSVES
jgi:ABC-2 type transport system permease protein